MHKAAGGDLCTVWQNRPRAGRLSGSMSHMTGSLNPAESPPANRLQRPRWLDLRLVLGVVLVAGAVLVGATVVSAADHRQAYWSLQRDVPAGAVLTAADLIPVSAQLGSSSGGYLPSSEAVVGKSVRHPLRQGQLLPRAELSPPEEGVTLTVPIRADNAPRLQRGDRVTLWLSTSQCRGAVLIGDVAVTDVRTSSAGALSSGNSVGVVIRLPVSSANRVVAALDADGAVIRVGVLSADGAAPVSSPDISRCWAASS
jgi:hypothetical protein